MKPRLVTTPAEQRRDYEEQLRGAIRDIEGAQELVRGIGRDLSTDYDGRAADAREQLATATAALGMAIWFLRGTKRSLP